MLNKRLAKQFTRYFGVALIGYIVDFGSLILLTTVLHIYYLVGASVGFILGLILTYILSNKYVFGESKIKSKSVQFGIFAIIGLVGLVILDFLMWIFTGHLGINYVVSKIIATVFVYTWNFFARRSMYHDQE